MKLGHVALDGTKLKASASKHKANSYKPVIFMKLCFQCVRIAS